jgi:hypothetical protein
MNTIHKYFYVCILHFFLNFLFRIQDNGYVNGISSTKKEGGKKRGKKLMMSIRKEDGSR